MVSKTDFITINIPIRIKNDYASFEFLAKTYHMIKELKSEKIIFDFSSTDWFEANLASVLGSILNVLKVNNCSVSFFNVSKGIKSIFKKNGFYTYYNLGKEIDTYNSTIPYKVFDVEDSEEFTVYLNEEVIPKIKLPLEALQVRTFKNCLQEVFENTSIHAHSNHVFTCGQYYHQRGAVAFTITDIGETIGSNVRRKKGDSYLDCDAIEWATQFGNTTKLNEDGGIGLHLIKNYMQDCGVFQIISGDGYWEQKNGEVYNRKSKHHFQGTIVNIISDLRIPINFDNRTIQF